MHYSPFDPRKSPLAPLFQRGGLLWNPNELGTASLLLFLNASVDVTWVR